MKALKVDGVFGVNTKKRMQRWLKVKQDGIVKSQTIKALQRRVGAKIDGKWGKGTTQKLQTYLKKHGQSGFKIDGVFGKATKKALQRFLNVYFKNQIDPKPVPPKPVPPTPVPTDKAAAIVAMAKACAYAYGSKLSTYSYKKGKPKAGYKTALNKAYPNRSKWSARPRAGASCDVFVGTVIRASGIDKSFPRGLDGVQKHCKGNSKWKDTGIKSFKQLKPGDVVFCQYSGGGHIYIYLGDGLVANAHYKAHGGTYGIVEKLSSMKAPSKCKTFKVYRAR